MNDKMIKDIRTSIKEKLINYYQLDNIKEIGGYQNFIYEGSKDNKNLILRVTNSEHRNKDEILAELNFVKLLYKNSVKVANVINLELLEVETDEFKYIISCFEKIEGKVWYEYPQDNNTYYEAGRILGKIHQVSKSMSKKLERTNWDKNEYLLIAKNVIDNKEIIEKMKDVFSDLNKLSKTDESYGLVHGDYNFANIIYKDNNDLTIIDFDECEYSWYIYDIAVYLFYYLLGGDPANIDIEANKIIFKYFIKGYITETNIEDYWIEKLPLFFKLREFILLSSIYRKLYPNNMNDWAKAYIETSEKRILNNLDFVDIDFLKIFNELKK